VNVSDATGGNILEASRRRDSVYHTMGIFELERVPSMRCRGGVVRITTTFEFGKVFQASQ
jgi:hypothetical protein